MPSAGPVMQGAGGAAGPRGLLETLTEEELGQYERIARDQVRREERWQPLLMVSAVLAGPVALVGLITAVRAGLGRDAFGALGLAGLMGYVPYRIKKSRTLWQSHVEAVASERQRRLAGGKTGGAGEGR